MRRVLLPLSLLILCTTSTAWADEIDLVFTVTTAAGSTQRAVTLRDVAEGPQPSVAIEVIEGRRMRLDTDISFRHADDLALETQILWDFDIWASTTDGEGREEGSLVSSPRIINDVEQPARIKQGQLARDGETELTLQIDVQYRRVESQE